jgi:hypothetical protein
MKRLTAVHVSKPHIRDWSLEASRLKLKANYHPMENTAAGAAEPMLPYHPLQAFIVLRRLCNEEGQTNKRVIASS